MIAQQYISQGFPVRDVLSAVDLSPSVYYYKPSGGTPGRVASTLTWTRQGRAVPNEQLLLDIEEMFKDEFVDYGYHKTTHWLRQAKAYIISYKKVYRIMKENGLLLKQIPRNKSGKQWIQDLVPKPTMPFEHLEFDIKYIYVHAERRNVLHLGVIDVYTRFSLAWMLQHRIRQKDVKAIFQYIIENYRLPEKCTVRCDNGSQFEANLVREFLAENKIIQEFCLPATPQQNGHIEAFNSIIERTICSQYEFDSFDDAWQTFDRFHHFYNYKRLHSGIDYKSPARFLFEKCGVTMPNKDHFLRGWRLETTANKQGWVESSGASAPTFPNKVLSTQQEKEFPKLKQSIVE